MMYANGPDWVMLGVPNPQGGVMIIASLELTQAELRLEAEMNLDSFFYIVGADTLKHYELSATMRSVVITVGETYADALRTLMENWKPTEPRRQAIGDQLRWPASVRRHPSNIPEIGP